MDDHVLTINGGSSSIKFALFAAGAQRESQRANPLDKYLSPIGEIIDPPGDPESMMLAAIQQAQFRASGSVTAAVRLQRIISGQIERIGLPDPRCSARDGDGQAIPIGPFPAADNAEAVQGLVAWLQGRGGLSALAAIGHRVVHGGPNYFATERIDDALLAELRRISPLDPAHLPGEIALIEAFARSLPKTPQFACFDTAFHHNLPRVARLLPLPLKYEADGIRRYGFHGLSYSYLMQELTRVVGPLAAQGRIILAHLGSGASMAAVRDGECLDTTMSFTPTAGLVMGTRCGDVDPGVLIHLLRSEGLSADQLDDLLNRRSGLLGVSETSSDMRDLLARSETDTRAAHAVALFCYQARKFIGSLAAALGGLDILVFAGGIGERAPTVRQLICDDLQFLGIRLEAACNVANDAVISAHDSRVAVRVIRTDEERWIAAEVRRALAGDGR